MAAPVKSSFLGKAQRYLLTDKIFVGILLIGVIGLAMDQVFRLLHRRLFPWLHNK